MYSTDNGAEMFTWPDGGDDAVPRREEHQLGGRLPRALPDPLAGRHQAGHGDQRHRAPTRTGCRRSCAAAGEPDIKDKLLKGYKAGDKTYKVHLDGYDQSRASRLDTGKRRQSARGKFFYSDDDGLLVGMRLGD